MIPSFKFFFSFVTKWIVFQWLIYIKSTFLLLSFQSETASKSLEITVRLIKKGKLCMPCAKNKWIEQKWGEIENQRFLSSVKNHYRKTRVFNYLGRLGNFDFFWAQNTRLRHTQLNVCEEEELPCFLYLIQIFRKNAVQTRKSILNSG